MNQTVGMVFRSGQTVTAPLHVRYREYHLDIALLSQSLSIQVCQENCLVDGLLADQLNRTYRSRFILNQLGRLKTQILAPEVGVNLHCQWQPL